MRKVFRILQMLATTRYLVRRLQNRFVLSNTRGRKFGTVVDVGVGTAPYRHSIVHEKYIGIDIEDRGGVPDCIINDINVGITLPDETADLVLCIEVLEHVKEPHKVAKEIYRITKRGGVVLFTAPMTWPEHEVPNDFFRFTKFRIEYLFRNAGFADIEIKPPNGHWYSIIQLSAINMRRPLWLPIVFVLNIIGFVVERFDRNTELPLVQYAIFRK